VAARLSRDRFPPPSGRDGPEIRSGEKGMRTQDIRHPKGCLFIARTTRKKPDERQLHQYTEDAAWNTTRSSRPGGGAQELVVNYHRGRRIREKQGQARRTRWPSACSILTWGLYPVSGSEAETERRRRCLTRFKGGWDWGWHTASSGRLHAVTTTGSTECGAGSYCGCTPTGEKQTNGDKPGRERKNWIAPTGAGGPGPRTGQHPVQTAASAGTRRSKNVEAGWPRQAWLVGTRRKQSKARGKRERYPDFCQDPGTR